MSCALRLENIVFSYDENNLIFNDANLSLDYGDFVLLSGLSGEGKSTRLSIINGVIPFMIHGNFYGKICADGKDITELPVSKRAEYIGTVLQNADEQIVYDKVNDEIAFGCENFCFENEKIAERIKASTSLLKLNPDGNTKTLSGGQKQRLVTASTLAMGQKIIILDEPLANLDKQGAEILLSTLRNLAENGYAVLIVEHRIDFVLPYINKVCVIEDRKIKTVENKESLLNNIKIIEHKTFDKTKTSEPIISGRNLNFNRCERNIIDKLDIDIFKCDRIVLLGENGCGKTTLMRILARLNMPDGGTLLQNILPKNKHKKPNRKWFKKVGFVYQNPSYQLFMPTLLDEVSFSASSKEKAIELINALGLAGLENRHPHSLSEGQKRRASIAAVLVCEPDVIFLDEPTVGQDYANLKRIVDTVNRIHEENKTTVITVTHDIRCASAMCDKVLIMDRGKIIKQGNHHLATEYLKGSVNSL